MILEFLEFLFAVALGISLSFFVSELVKIHVYGRSQLIDSLFAKIKKSRWLKE